MKISKVTLTGADNSISPSDLIPVSKRFPFVEWGILLSKKRSSPGGPGGTRFPEHIWLEFLASENHRFSPMQLSGHLCGDWVNEALMGNWGFVGMLPSLFWKQLKRIQINTHGVYHPCDIPALIQKIKMFPDKEFIFQWDNKNTSMILQVAEYCKNVSVLFDLSHGAGILPKEWPVPVEKMKCGYAGGLSPENVKESIDKISEKVGDAEIWIDMETHIRSEQDALFDLDKCCSVLETCLETGTISKEVTNG